MQGGARIAAVLARRRLVVCVGAGGVGKTTVAAALALAAARDGKRVFVLTIDPARRLADALGLSLGDGDSEVPLEGASGRVHAAMLETRASWDAFVSRVAPDAEARERILGNRVYRAFSRTLARSHAYVAMERLHHVLAERDASGAPRWDLVVLDTPPTRSALEIVDAPTSLSRFLDERVVGGLVGAAGALRRPGTLAARRVLGWIMGDALAHELVGFLELFAPLRAGFAARSSDVRAQLLDDATAFVLVAAPLATHLEDAAFLRDDLARRGVALHAVVMNRAFHTDPGDPGAPLARDARWDPDAAIALLAAAPGGAAVEAAAVIGEAIATRRRCLADDARAEAAIDGFLSRRRPAHALALPMMPREPCSPAELLGLLDAAQPC